jgi:hypothetical protein
LKKLLSTEKAGKAAILGDELKAQS